MPQPTEKEITIETILTYLEESIAQKIPISPHTWVDAAQKINVLVGNESDKLADLQQYIAKVRASLISEGKTASASKVFVEAMDEYAEAQKLKAKIGRIEEMIRIAKLQARLKVEEARGTI